MLIDSVFLLVNSLQPCLDRRSSLYEANGPSSQEELVVSVEAAFVWLCRALNINAESRFAGNRSGRSWC